MLQRPEAEGISETQAGSGADLQLLDFSAAITIRLIFCWLSQYQYKDFLSTITQKDKIT